MARPGECNICHKLHDENMACPLRIANAYTMQPQALEKLTNADKEWMAEHPDFSVLDAIEDAITNSL